MSISTEPRDPTIGDMPADIPPLVVRIQAIGLFKMSSEPRVGALLRTLAASKPGGRVLEVGSGVGIGAAWLLAGMGPTARLTTLEIHARTAEVCRRLLSEDPRAEVITTDAIEWLENYSGPPFDLVFVDTTIAKFERRDLLYRHMANGALLIADDLLPQEKWVAAHPARVERFRREIVVEPDLVVTLLDWASGLAVAAYHKSP